MPTKSQRTLGALLRGKIEIPNSQLLKFLNSFLPTSVAISLFCIVVLSGCSLIYPRDREIGSTSGLLADAHYRLIFERTRDAQIITASMVSNASSPLPIAGAVDTSKIRSKGTIAVEHKVVCAEPSPDVATAITLALSGTASGIGATDAPRGGFTSNYVEAITALGKRTATIQMLRDMQYRDCEAYANGMTDELEYAARMNRFNALAATLLAMESVSESYAASGVQAASAVPQAEAILGIHKEYLGVDAQYTTSIVCYQVLSNPKYNSTMLSTKCTEYWDKVITASGVAAIERKQANGGEQPLSAPPKKVYK